MCTARSSLDERPAARRSPAQLLGQNVLQLADSQPAELFLGGRGGADGNSLRPGDRVDGAAAYVGTLHDELEQVFLPAALGLHAELVAEAAGRAARRSNRGVVRLAIAVKA